MAMSLIWVSPWGRLTVRLELLPAVRSSCIPEELDTEIKREDGSEWIIWVSPWGRLTIWLELLPAVRSSCIPEELDTEIEREKIEESKRLIWVSPWGRLTVRLELLPADWSSCIPEELDTKMEREDENEWLICVSPWGRLTVRLELLPADWSSCIPEELDTKMEREDEREWLIDLCLSLRKTHRPAWAATRWLVQLHTRRTMYKDRERRWKRVIDWFQFHPEKGSLSRLELLPAEWSSCIPEELDTKIEREIMEEQSCQPLKAEISIQNAKNL